MSTTTTTTSTATDACVLLGAQQHTATALTGIDLILPAAIALVIVATGIALVIAARRRSSEDERPSTPRRLMIPALIVGALAAAGIAALVVASPARAASSESSSCDLIDYVVTQDTGDALIGGEESALERATVTNITDGSIDLRFAASVVTDVDGLGAFVTLRGVCGCSQAPLVDGVLGTGIAPGQSVRLTAGQSVTLQMTGATTAAIANDHQNTTLTYTLVAHATEVRA
ncbi:hypothetical protein [Herbiconiux sp. L3-i23]|uniref:hypothetical protein n=1 Tax=Herbiconiux sp. L3-i23 TaxID=2905871 RepID=UPI002045F21B|nr:hypothetical protein [Herbiconiux sp. L3-i23]BDI23890.1 hypothetical protein L3i23_26660 [Herbiconiux sp. L3-i23]